MPGRTGFKGIGFLLIACLLGLLPAAVQAQGTVSKFSEEATDLQVVLLRSDPEGLVVEWRSPVFSIDAVAVEGTLYSRIVAPGMGFTGEAGHPQLPAGESWLGLPPGVTAEVTVWEAEREEVRLPHPVLPTPQVFPPEPPPGEEALVWPAEPPYRYLPDAAVYGSAAAYPGALARIEGEGWIRSQRVALLRFYPFQYEPATGILHVYRRLRVEVRFGSGVEGGTAVPEPAPFEALFRTMLLNADQARLWRSTAAPPALPASPPAFPPRPAVKVLVDHDGFYRLPFETLRQAGVPLNEVDLHTLRLYLDGQEVALWVPDEEPHPGEPAEALFFYGQGARSKYTRENVYWLTWGEGEGRRMAERPGCPAGRPPLGSFVATVHSENNAQYTSLFPIGGDDMEHWFWTYLYTGGTREGTFPLFTPAPAADLYTATLRLSLYGGFAAWPNPDHHVQVYLNDAFLGEGWWDGQSRFTLELAFPQSRLNPGENRVRLYAPGDTGYGYDYFYLDWIEASYRRTFTVEDDLLEFALEGTGSLDVQVEAFSGEDILVLDTSDPQAPVRIAEGTVEATPGGYRYTFAHQDTGGLSRYLATTLSRAEEPRAVKDQPSTLYAPDNQADVLLIAPAELLPTIEPLAAEYAEEGLSALMVDVQDIYDEFSGGRRDPRAIRSFLAYTYAHWTPPAPTYVLLVGDGHYDFKDYLQSGLPNRIPPYLAYVDPWIGETAADNRYVSLVGNDVLADMLLGRLPVNSPEEAAAVVDKILAYRQAEGPADWQGRVLFVADNADGAGNFPALSDEMANFYLPTSYTADKVYLGVNYPYENPAVTARSAILQALDSGRLLLNYIGHGAIYFLANEQMLQAGDADTLNNGNSLPVLLSWSCYAGLYSLPYPSSAALGEVWVRAPHRGAIAAWVPTGLGLAWAHHYMNKGFFEALFLGREVPLGQAALAGNLRLYAAAPSMGYHLETYVLLGDPTLKVPVLPADLALQAGSSTPQPIPAGGTFTMTIALTNTGPATAYEVILRAELPAGWSLQNFTSPGLDLTLVSHDPPIWKVAQIPAGAGGILFLHFQAGMEEGRWPLTFTAETGSRDLNLENNLLSLEVNVALAGRPHLLLAQVVPPAVPPGGQATLQVTVLDAAGRPVPDGTVVSFAATQGRIIPQEVVTIQGLAQTTFLAEKASGEVWLTVSSGPARSLVLIRILPTPDMRTLPGAGLRRGNPTGRP